MRSNRDRLMIGASLKLEVATAEVFRALSEAGVHAIVLKGVSFARWLHDGPGRYSSDIDLLVAPSERQRAERVLAELGFGPLHGDEHARDWIRHGDGTIVDLHDGIIGPRVPADLAWRTLSERTEPLPLHGVHVEVLAPRARALHVVLHAAQHGFEVGSALDDLSRALQRVAEDDWEAAAALAAELDATEAFAAGLRLVPAGRELAARLALPTKVGAETALRASTPPPVALGFFHLATTRGIRNKATILRAELAPPAAFMRSRHPIARRGRLGLAGAYAWRPFWIAWHAAPAAKAWLRARAESRRSS